MAGERQVGRITEGSVVEEQCAPAWKHHKEAPPVQLRQLFPVVYSHNGVVCILERKGNSVTMAT